MTAPLPDPVRLRLPGGTLLTGSDGSPEVRLCNLEFVRPLGAGG